MADIRVKPAKRTPAWVSVLWFAGALGPAASSSPGPAVLTHLAI